MTFNKKSQFLLASASGLAITMAIATTAMAQATSDTALETITVTGERGFGSKVSQIGGFRGAQIVDIPATINVLPRDLLDAQGVQGLNDILKNISGSTTAQTSPVVTSNETIRGIAIDNRNGFRLDGSLPIINLVELPIEDKERVEVLKGASGLYYGFASPAGVINLTMKRPTADPLFDLTLMGNGYGAAGAAVDFGNTVGNGMFGYRINAVYDGENPGINGTFGDRSLIAGAFDFKPTDNFTSQLDIEHIYKKQAEPAIFRFITGLGTPTIANPYPTFAIPDVKSIDPTTNAAPNWAQYRAEETNVLWHNVYNIADWWEVSADAGDSKFSRTRNTWSIQPTNFTTGAGVSQYLLSTQENENRNLRFQTAATFDTFFLKHNVIAGWADNQRDGYAANSPQSTCVNGVYVNSSVTTGSATAVGTSVNTSCQTNITSVNGIAVNYLNPTFAGQISRAVPVPNSTYYNGQVERIEDSGFYIFDRIQYGDYVEVSAGGRFGSYNDEIIKPTRSKKFHATPNTTAEAVTVKPFGNHDLAIYASYVEALEPGAAGPITVNNPGVTTAPLPSIQTEIGVKSEVFDGLLLSADFFTIKRGATFINAANFFVADGTNKYQGVEANVSGEITEDLSVYATAMLLMAKQTTGAPTCGPGTAVGTLGGSCAAFTPTLVGLEISNTAKGYGTFFAQYKLGHILPFLDGMAINGGFQYVDHRPLDSQNRANLGGYTVFDAGASYDTDAFQYPMTFRVSAKNIFGLRYWAGGDQDQLAPGVPSDVEMSLKIHL
jgi:iron complex outermembrane receptor protein